MTDRDYPTMPNAYKAYIRDGIKEAEFELEHEGNVIPGSFTESDNIPPELVEAVIWRESEFNPSAINTKGYCNNSGGRATGLGQFCINPGGDVGGSLELGDYQAVTGDKLNISDVLDERTAIHLVAFGLGDRYARLKNKNDGKQYNDWYRAVQGYSPITEEQYVPYKEDLYQYISEKYGEDRALEIAQNAGQGFGSEKDCGSIPWYSPLEKAACTAELLYKIGKNPETPGYAADEAKGVLTDNIAPIIGIGVGILAVLIGALILFKQNNPTAIAARALT